MGNEPADMMAAVERSMKERTGRSLEEWVREVGAAGLDPVDQRAVRAWLRDVHLIPQNSQWAIADRAATEAGWVRPDVEGYVEAMYAGTKAVLRPLHDAAVELAVSVGEPAEAQGRATYIPIVRRTQFAAVGPGTRGRLKVGLRFRQGTPGDERFDLAKGFAQATHIVHIEVPDSVASGEAPTREQAREAVAWLEPFLRRAWEEN